MLANFSTKLFYFSIQQKKSIKITKLVRNMFAVITNGKMHQQLQESLGHASKNEIISAEKKCVNA